MSNLFKYDDPNVIDLVKRQLAFIEEHNNRKYPTPNSNYQNIIRNAPDILGAYADEVVELRKLAFKALNLAIDVRNSDIDPDKPISKDKNFNAIIKFVSEQPWYKLHYKTAS